MSNNFENYIKRIDVAPNISIGLRIDEKIETYGNCELMYDLASLTKVFCGILVIKLSELGYYQLDDKVSKYINIEKDIKINQLLTHTSGLSDQMIDFDQNGLLSINLDSHQTELGKVEYADINYILLYYLILNFGDYQQLLKEYITTNLDIVYKPDSNISNFAPTEIRADRGLVHGVVHDSKAFKMGGVSGHAGLFANLDSLIVFFNRLVNGDVIKLDYFKNLNAERNLLFEVKDARNQMDSFEGKASFHTGFTGTSVLINFEERQFIIILTNRISPNRLNQNIFGFRKEVHEQFYKRCQRSKK